MTTENQIHEEIDASRRELIEHVKRQMERGKSPQTLAVSTILVAIDQQIAMGRSDDEIIAILTTLIGDIHNGKFTTDALRAAAADETEH